MTKSLSLVNPATEAVFTEVPCTTEAQLQAAVAAARRAQAAWRTRPVAERARIVGQLVPQFKEASARVALDITRQMGKPLAQAHNEVRTMIDRAETMCRIAPEALADETLPPKAGFTRFIRPEPLGVVLNIAAWNYPLLIPVNVVVPALIAGNAVLIKHSPLTPLCGQHFVDAAVRTELPEGLLANLVIDHETTGRLMDSGAVDHVTFTGSVRGGHEVYTRASRRFIDVGLELGGKDPAYVRRDALFEFAVENLVDGAFYNAGQSCCAVERIYVDRAIFDPFVEAYVTLAKGYVLGNPEDPATTMGPLAQKKGLELVHSHIEEARAGGAKVLTGGEKWTKTGFFCEPTVVVNVRHDMKIMQEESFGPVIGIMPVTGDDEAIRLMNDSPFGLTASVWSADAGAGAGILDQLVAGTVFLNRCDYLDPLLPWVGVKDSGKGASLSHHGFRHLTRPKSYHLRTSIP